MALRANKKLQAKKEKPLTDNEKSLVNQVLKFASLKRIKSPKQVEDVFSPPLIQSVSPEKVPYEELGYDSFEEAEQAGRLGFIDDQAELLGKLDGLIKYGSQSGLDHWLNEIFEDKVYLIRPYMSSGRLIHFVGCGGVEAAYAYAIALLVDRDLENHLRQCPECGRYFMIYDEQKLRTKYCRPECQLEAKRKTDAARQKAYRLNNPDK